MKTKTKKKALEITHVFDAIKKEAIPESEAMTSSTKNNETNSKINIKQEYVKEEIDIPWDEISYIVDKEQDDLYLRKHMDVSKVWVIIDKLPDSIVQNFKDEIITAENNENDNGESNSSIIPNNCTKKTDRNFRNNTDSNKIDKVYDSDFYWKICTICNKKYEIIRHQRKMHNCIQCKNSLIYECKICHRQLFSDYGIRFHVRSKCISKGFYHKCFQCDFKAVNKNSVRSHVKHKHPTMISQMRRIEMIKSSNVQNDVGKTRFKCSKCEKNFEFLPKLMKHIQICTGKEDKTNNENQGIVEEVSQSVSDRMLIYCQGCDKDTAYFNETLKGDRYSKKRCPHCETIMKFKCSECQIQCASRHSLACHITSKHSGTQEYNCPECDYKNSVLNNLCRHYKWMHTSEIHECPECGQKYDKRLDMHRHLEQCALRRQYNCDHCSYKSYHRNIFINHLLSHSTSTAIDCPSCKLAFKNKICLKSHRAVCGKSPHLKCEDCSFKTNYKRILKEHKLRMHSIKSDFIECPNCKKMHRNRECLKGHLRFCKAEEHCNYCSFTTKFAAALRNHMLRFHAEDNDISSDIRKSGKHCNVTFKKYRCDHCSYECNVRVAIYHHIVKKHLKEKNIKCSRCSAKFQNNVYLDQHLQYCGLKPYLHCAHCAFKTYRRGELNVHMKHKHLNYECPKCKERFQRKVALRRHWKGNYCNGILD